MKSTKFLLLGLAATAALASCKKDPEPTTPPTSGSIVYLRGSITSNTTLHKKDTVYLRGYVYVESGATLTIEPGTTILSKKDSAGVLVIYKGAKIMAEGTAADPIVFTSGESTKIPGDLGGVVLVGNATVNGNHATLEGGVDNAHKNFGGTDDGDNSGILKYVRIEYGGKAVAPNDEVNGLSLYGVGNGTTIDYVQVIRGLDDAFEFFGGAVNCKHLIAYNCADDDYDMDDSYKGKIQFAISFKDPAFTDGKGTTGDISNNFEVDNTNGTLPFNTLPRTNPLLANFTAIGPNGAAGASPDYGFGMRWRRGCTFHLGNSIVLGGQKGIMNLRDTTTIRLYSEGASNLSKCLLAASPATSTPFVVDNNAPLSYDNAALQTSIATGNTILAAGNNAMLTDPFNVSKPNVKPQTGSPALTSGTDWTGAYADPFFDKVSFVGAMDASNDWTSGWAVWGK
jgi:hypothetical protein